MGSMAKCEWKLRFGQNLEWNRGFVSPPSNISTQKHTIIASSNPHNFCSLTKFIETLTNGRSGSCKWLCSHQAVHDCHRDWQPVWRYKGEESDHCSSVAGEENCVDENMNMIVEYLE